MKEFWNDRYSTESYVYGKEPNRFFRKQIDSLKPGQLLLPGEGEGRNAVYAAKKGWEVTAFDYSEQAKKKALDFARAEGVSIQYEIRSADDWKENKATFDAAALIFVHLPKDIFKQLIEKILVSLKSGGKLIIEGYSVAQLGHDSGGPKDPDLLYDAKHLRSLLEPTEINLFEEIETDLDEGSYHRGKAMVIRAVVTIP
ncbi:SAM-dependent methyltransferase [Rhodohalobacter mucosus]|uniref:SAM-dependent methyltransferase n=1 Tax=Rhodohalobacter mucosus TaxID=2079485 RepID=A0A316U380_9BACT|nr:class I SAM-dependent methyltransferase [Rhodohalobacter mucosus]PWN07846.1 SAM-dependent methyltransferase [Rhodohalobacter mucosus]